MAKRSNNAFFSSFEDVVVEVIDGGELLMLRLPSKWDLAGVSMTAELTDSSGTGEDVLSRLAGTVEEV